MGREHADTVTQWPPPSTEKERVQLQIHLQRRTSSPLSSTSESQYILFSSLSLSPPLFALSVSHLKEYRETIVVSAQRLLPCSMAK